MSKTNSTNQPADKLARKRLSVLQLAEALGNVSEACRRSNMDRTSFYEWKTRFTEMGLEGLKDLPPVHRTHPQTTPPEVVEKVIETSLEHPTWGCTKVSDYLRLQQVSVSSPTVQKILIQYDMGSRYERLLKLEERHLQTGIYLSEEQIKLIEQANPVFAERHVETSKPGELLCQDTKQIGTISGIGRIYLHCVVDAFGSYGFGFLHINKIPEAAVAVLHNEALPQYQEWGIEVEAVLTDNGREFCGTDAHPFELYLRLNDIEHRKTQVRRPQTNGFAERFIRTVKEEFVPEYFRKNLYTSVDQLQQDFDQWVHQYNHIRPHRGYRNMGKRPYDTVKKFVKSNSKNVSQQA